MSYLLLAAIVFCGCSIDTAFDTPQGCIIWGVAFVTAILCAAAIGRGNDD